jgi:hypothetical protein
MSFSHDSIAKVMDILLLCLSDENIEVREMAATTLAGVLRCSQRQSIVPLKVRSFCGMTDRQSSPTKFTGPLHHYHPQDKASEALGAGVCCSLAAASFSDLGALRAG